MSGIYRVTHVPSGRIEKVLDRKPGFYVTPDGRGLWITPQFIWCRQCAAVQLGEHIPTIFELRCEIIRRRDPRITPEELARSAASETTVDSLLRKRTAIDNWYDEYDRCRLEWIANRKSLPKCLTCGSTEIICRDADGTLRLPDGTTLTFMPVGFAGDAVWMSDYYFAYSPEGDRIRGLTYEEWRSGRLHSQRDGASDVG